MKTLINTNQEPFIPEGFAVESHDTTLGKISLKDCSLYLSEKQKEGNWVEGDELRKEIKNPLNAVVLEYLLKNPKQIPEEWKEKGIYFWGTIYRLPHGRLCVRYLCFYDGRWHWHCRWLIRDWLATSPAAVLASPLDTKNLDTSVLGRLVSLEKDMNKIKKFLIL